MKTIQILNDVIKSPFIALYDYFTNEDYFECNTKEEAIEQLQEGSNRGQLMDIAVINSKTHEMIWYQEFLGKEECEERVNNFIKKHCNN